MTRQLIWTGFITLDGVVDSPGGAVEGHPLGGWVLRTPFDADAYSLKAEELDDTSALVFGRRSYEAFAPVWRDSDDHAAYRDLPKFVVSSTLADDDLLDGWGETTILRSSADVAALKQTEGGNLYIHGSAELGLRLGAERLVDGYNLLVFPYVLGSGKRVLAVEGGADRTLELRESAAYPNGVVKLVYRVTS